MPLPRPDHVPDLGIRSLTCLERRDPRSAILPCASRRVDVGKYRDQRKHRNETILSGSRRRTRVAPDEPQCSDQGILSDGVAVAGAARAAPRRCGANVAHSKGAGPDTCRAILTRDRHGGLWAVGARPRGRLAGPCAAATLVPPRSRRCARSAVASRSRPRRTRVPGRAALGHLGHLATRRQSGTPRRPRPIDSPSPRWSVSASSLDAPFRRSPSCSDRITAPPVPLGLAVVVHGRARKSWVEIPGALACARDARLRAHRVETRSAGKSGEKISSTENRPVPRPAPPGVSEGQRAAILGCAGAAPRPSTGRVAAAADAGRAVVAVAGDGGPWSRSGRAPGAQGRSLAHGSAGPVRPSWPGRGVAFSVRR